MRIETKVGFDWRTDRFPSSLTSWCGDSPQPQVLELSPGATHYGFVQNGVLRLRCTSGEFELSQGMYFACPEPATLEVSGAGFCASRHSYTGFFSLGGPIESEGRLRYIDGCSDSLLVAPVILGDPCLNLLYLPPGTSQTAHTHPSVRSGIIVDGRGVCRCSKREIPLSPGMIFEIPPNAEHSFHTLDSPLRVIAWHPDSDCGPAHDDHPMINRTMIDGVSAALRRQANS